MPGCEQFISRCIANDGGTPEAVVADGPAEVEEELGRFGAVVVCIDWGTLVDRLCIC